MTAYTCSYPASVIASQTLKNLALKKRHAGWVSLKMDFNIACMHALEGPCGHGRGRGGLL